MSKCEEFEERVRLDLKQKARSRWVSLGDENSDIFTLSQVEWEL